MKLYNLVSLDEPLKTDVGIGVLLQALRDLLAQHGDIGPMSQYTVIETNGLGDVLDKQPADDWLKSYYKTMHDRHGFQEGDVVASTKKTLPIYKLVKLFQNTAWVRPCDPETFEMYGSVQKGVPYDILAMVVV